MAEFLRTTGISHNIEEIIINAKEKLVIVSPYLKLTENLFERLKEKDSEKIEITFIYGKSELNEYEKKKLYSLSNLNLYFYRNLHAKCYYNESEMLITSMNLHEFSERNNREMGILIKKENDIQIFKNAEQESISIKNASSLEKKAVINPTINIQNQNIKDFDFIHEGDISLWNIKLQSLLNEKYSSSEFKIDSYKSNIECYSFISNYVSLIIEPEIEFMRIVFKFNGKNRKKLFYMIQAIGKKEIESSFPKAFIGWGNQMMRIKLDISKASHPILFKYDRDSLISTLEYIEVGGNIISKILKDVE